MKHAAFIVLAVLQLLGIALVWVTVMPLLLAARGVIVVCAEANRRPQWAAPLILGLAWAGWRWVQ